VITVANSSYPKVIAELKQERKLGRADAAVAPARI